MKKFFKVFANRAFEDIDVLFQTGIIVFGFMALVAVNSVVAEALVSWQFYWPAKLVLGAMLLLSSCEIYVEVFRAIIC